MQTTLAEFPELFKKLKLIIRSAAEEDP